MGAALSFMGGALNQLGISLGEKQKQKHDDEILKSQQLSSLILKNMGNEAGQIDPKFGIPIVSEIISGHYNALNGDGKGKGKKGSNPIAALLSDPDALSSFVLGIHQASSSKPATGPAGPTGLPSGGTAAGGDAAADEGNLPARSIAASPAKTSIFNSAADVDARAERNYETRKRFDTNESIRAANETDRYGAQRNRITWTPGQVSGKDLEGETDMQGRPIDPAKSYKVGQRGDGSKQIVPIETKAQPLRAEQKRAAQLAEQDDKVWENLTDQEKQGYTTLASRMMDRERKVSETQKQERLNAYLNMSRQALVTNKERYDELVTLAPYVLSAKMAGLDLDAARLGKLTAGTDPAKIVETATKTAKSLAAKGSKILQSLGLQDDEAAIRRGLIQDLSGGRDPDEVEAEAKSKATPKSAVTTKPGADANPFRK